MRSEQRLAEAFDSATNGRSAADVLRMEEQRDEIVAIIEDASEPLARKDIEAEMDLTRTTLKRRLKTLRENGRIETVEGADGRRPYYEVTEGDD